MAEACPIDETHDARTTSWIVSANGHAEFPLQNLPLGIFSPSAGGDGSGPRAGVAIGDEIVDLAALCSIGLLRGEAEHAARAATGASLNALFALGAGPRRVLRRTLFQLLCSSSGERERITPCLHASSACRMHLPAVIGDFTDFYAGINHARNVGQLFRPEYPLLPNYKYVPVAYHGRSSSIAVSPSQFRRPNGQIKTPSSTTPRLGPCRRLDYEVELGIWVGTGNADGTPISIDRAGAAVAGYCLLNDWSARDIQTWEYQPLGPFLAKNFCTAISNWVITPEALAPFCVAQPARPTDDPKPLAYLWSTADQESGALAIEIEVAIRSAAMRMQEKPWFTLARTDTRNLYWTPAQMVTHHTIGGCNLLAGDLLGTGTISGSTPGSFGSLLEASEGGRCPIRLPTGEERRFVEDSDEIRLSATARRDGFVTIGFGSCLSRVVPATQRDRN
jgi:fumarylacetoacetase